ncbi:hypothetical protein PV341_31105 [Streptomyces sp. PA03-1a]|nr:hypothetical protein [Streptomyces sp. PA03-1a]MDX2813395.1 hypothetical protein [Streptomyces sp. PA03-5A]
MTATITTATTDAVFAEAARATSWKVTNLGPVTEVRHGSYTWTVQLPTGSGPATVTHRDGWGGVEFVGITATPAQTIGIVEAAMAATRVL